MDDLGSDFHCITDFDPNLSMVSGRTCLAEAIARRLLTPRTGLWYDADYGTDIRQYLHAPAVSTNDVASAAQAECLKDERVESASVTAAVGASGDSLTLTIELTDSTGPFSFVLDVSNVSAAILAG